MRINKRAQSLLEYVTIIAFVMVGIILGGEYAMRAMSGGIANLTRSEETSREELLRQGPPDPGIKIPGCNCTAWSPPICGGGACNQRQMYTARSCVGAGCQKNFEFKCTYDDTCCSDPTLVTPSPDGCGAHSAPPCTARYGEGWACWQCGNLPIQCGCKPFNECRFRCGYDVATRVQNNPDPLAEICPLDDQNIFRNNLPWLLQGNNSSACSNPAGSKPKCETYCKKGTVKQGNKCVSCLRPTTVAHRECQCKGKKNGPNCYHQNTPVDVIATCPKGLVATGGHCFCQNQGYGDDCFVRWMGARINGKGEHTWNCEGVDTGNHQTSCRHVHLYSVAKCEPPTPCYKPVLIDLTHTWQKECSTINARTWTGGRYRGTAKYKTVGVFYNVYYCALVDSYIPAPPSPSCLPIVVMSDQFLYGYGVPWIAQWPHRIYGRNFINSWSYGCATPPCCDSNTYVRHQDPRNHLPGWRKMHPAFGCCPAGWKIEGHNNHNLMLTCTKYQASFCSGTCPAGFRKQKVVKDSYMAFVGCAGQNRPGCAYNEDTCLPGWTHYAGPGIPSKMLQCMKLVDICVSD